MNRLLWFVFIGGALFSSAGCGSGDGDDDFESPEVTDIDLQDETIEVGEGTVMSVEFTFDRENVFDDSDSVDVVVKIPNEVSYREGTAEVDEDVGGDNDVSPEITLCADGSSFLRFNLDENDLKDAENPEGDADVRLTLTIDSVGGPGSFVIEGRADENSAPFGCVGNFLAEDRVVLNVL